MRVNRKILGFAVVLAAASPAAAQSTGDGPPPSTTSTNPWAAQPGERHIMGRLLANGAIRLGDPWGAGTLAPPTLLAQGGFLFINAGPLRMGPALGVQFGFDLGHSGMQYTLQPGWMAMTRLSSLLGLTFRVDVPVLFTRGRCEPQIVPARMGSPVRAPIQGCYTTAFGFELGAAVAFYLTSGIALTAELNGSFYFGDSFYTYPLIGLGLGVQIDYEILP